MCQILKLRDPTLEVKEEEEEIHYVIQPAKAYEDNSGHIEILSCQSCEWIIDMGGHACVFEALAKCSPGFCQARY